ncbi:MAG TPA: DUF2877 domain-containing protein [Thermodesulfobacteriota bacterium]|nr:DUF2877 domain-containing protein [Thermodesulfobacteriota bacterium]
MRARMRDPKEFYIMRESGVDRISLEAEAIGRKALKALGKSGGEIEVHSVFDHAVYISVGKNELIKLIRNKDFINPYSILIKQQGGAPMTSLGFEAGDRVTWDGNRLDVGSGALLIDLSHARVYKKERLFKKNTMLGADTIAFNLRIMRDVIYTHPGREGLVPLLEDVETRGPMKVFLEPREESVSEKARPHIEQLMWGLFTGDLAAVTEKAGAILGLGPGLTPSCDDFLAGLLLSLGFAGKSFYGKDLAAARFFKKAGDAIYGLSKEKTTIYSRGLIDDARHGEGPRSAVGLIRCLVTGSPEDTASASKTLIGMGASTGADLAVGIYYGVRFLVSRLETEALYEIA